MHERCNSYARERNVCLRPLLRKNQLTDAKGVSVRACRYTKFANKVSIRYSIPICNMVIHYSVTSCGRSPRVVPCHRAGSACFGTEVVR
jgi:hypothetical protein